VGLLTRLSPRARETDESTLLPPPEPEPGFPRRPKDPAFVGDYRVLRLLGEGGMGTVYLGESVDGRRVAVKVIQSEYARDPEFRERFRAETAHARQVEEAYTAAVLDADPDAALPYLVTEYVPGPTLRAAVNAGGPLGTGDLARLAVGMAAALTAIHGAGIAHHDLKPGNVLLGPSGPRVIDFGIAGGFGGPGRNGQAADQAGASSHQHGRGGRGRGRGRRAQAQEATQVGTPGYMAPEQARGDEAGPAADVFAWAAVMTFAASGVPPFGEGSPEELLRRVTLDTPDLGALPDELVPLVQAAFSKQPRDRPSAGDLLLMLMGEKSARRDPERPLALPPAPVPAAPAVPPLAPGADMPPSAQNPPAPPAAERPPVPALPMPPLLPPAAVPLLAAGSPAPTASAPAEAASVEAVPLEAALAEAVPSEAVSVELAGPAELASPVGATPSLWPVAADDVPVELASSGGPGHAEPASVAPASFEAASVGSVASEAAPPEAAPLEDAARAGR